MTGADGREGSVEDEMRRKESREDAERTRKEKKTPSLGRRCYFGPFGTTPGNSNKKQEHERRKQEGDR